MSQLFSQKRVSRRQALVGGTLSLAALISSLSLHSCSSPDASCPPPGGALTVNFYYSTEKYPWLHDIAIPAFNCSNPQYNGKSIYVQGFDTGSLDIVEKIVNNELSPRADAWSPASDLEWHWLEYRWSANKQSSQINHFGEMDVKSLLQTPFVFAVWKDFADVLLQTYERIDWDTLHEALSLPNGWQNSKLQKPAHPNWGSLIHLGQTCSDLSNSGLLSIILMGCAYYGPSNEILTLPQAEDNATWQYIDDFEGVVNGFGKSSGTYFTENVLKQGPPAHAVVFTYESLVLQQNPSSGKDFLQMFYPQVNFISTHPFVILDNPSRPSDEQKDAQQAAKMFREFLLRNDQQQAAIRQGFRPADWAHRGQPLTFHQTPTPFDQYALFTRGNNINQQAFNQQISTPHGDVVDKMINRWKTEKNGEYEADCL